MTIQEFLEGTDHAPEIISLSSLPIISDARETIETIKEFCETTGEFFKGMAKIMYYFFHPKQLAWMLWSGLVANSLEICLMLCLLSILACLIGWRKGKKIATGSILFYGVIQAINAAL